MKLDEFYSAAINFIPEGVLATFAGLTSYYYYIKREKVAIKLIELFFFLTTAVLFAIVCVNLLGDNLAQYSTGVAGLAGLISHEALRYLTKDGVIDIIKAILGKLLKR